ncbi:MAG: hypothetical protein A3J14_01985 [Candidatus Levybacteria bacterium RIFCSPLOWO2_02_FULL_37_18]|nr:MAG: hypothetical protein A3J14_01985 [Candidatus Levybacteria bacterium RIFCSPLOWO2_02_FULL_37_18]
MKKLNLLLIFFVLFLSIQSIAFANSSYVLPYPSSMPGSIPYKVHVFIEHILKYWYFGSFSQFKYNRKYADKYLIEAKVLFEYGQYPLAIKALEKSNFYFKNESDFLVQAERENKNISEKMMLLKNASQKHIEVLEKIKKEVPEKFNWSPEKSIPYELQIRTIIDKAIKDRMQVYE